MRLTIFTCVEDGRVGHQVTHVAQEQQRATMQFDFAAFLGFVHAVCVEATGEGLAILFNRFDQSPFDDAQPIAVAQNFVVCIHGGHRVFQVQDGGQGGFHNQVAHACGVGGANGGVAVDLQVQVQTVVFQQHR